MSKTKLDRQALIISIAAAATAYVAGSLAIDTGNLFFYASTCVALYVVVKNAWIVIKSARNEQGRKASRAAKA